MTDTAQEQERVEDWTDKHLSDELLRLSRFYPSDSYWKEAALEASRRILARQREDGRVEVPVSTVLMANLGSRLIGALWELPGFEHTKGNSVVEDVLDLARRLRARQREGEREPVAWRYRWRYADESTSDWHWLGKQERNAGRELEWLREQGYEIEPVYTEPPAEREPEPNVIPNTDLIREWIKEYEHFSTEGGPDYYPDLAAFIHDQIARRATTIRFNAHPDEPPADTEEES